MSCGSTSTTSIYTSVHKNFGISVYLLEETYNTEKIMYIVYIMGDLLVFHYMSIYCKRFLLSVGPSVWAWPQRICGSCAKPSSAFQPGQEVTFEPTSNAHARVDYNTLTW